MAHDKKLIYLIVLVALVILTFKPQPEKFILHELGGYERESSSYTFPIFGYMKNLSLKLICKRHLELSDIFKYFITFPQIYFLFFGNW